MPGIAGIITKIPKEKSEADLGIMIECMMHEPHYVSITYQNEGMGIYAGWVGHKGTFSDCMPVGTKKRIFAFFFPGRTLRIPD